VKRPSVPESVRLRFAPSPTGSLHVGSARTMLYNWLVAKQFNGHLLLRIEDTDRSRNNEADVQEIYRMLDWLGLDYQEELRQSDRAEAHQQALQALVDNGHVYRNEATGEDVKEWKKANGSDHGFRGQEQGRGSYRLRLDNQRKVTIHDLIQGEKTFDCAHMDDPVIARADGSPLYNLAVAVDDADADIQLVLRGEDHVSNIPKQALILEALDKALPIYAHLPLLHGPDGCKLSKSHKTPQGEPLAITVEQLRAQGLIPEAVVSYLAQLGWGQDDEQILSKEELIEQFDITTCSRNPAQFDIVKLRHINGEWLRRLQPNDFAQRLADFADRPVDDKLRLGAAAVQERSRDLQEAVDYLSYSWAEFTMDEKAQRKFLKPESRPVLEATRQRLATLEQWDQAHIEEVLAQLPEQFPDTKPLKLFQPLRVALTGRSVSPPMAETLLLLDQKTALERLDNSLAKL